MLLFCFSSWSLTFYIFCLFFKTSGCVSLSVLLEKALLQLGDTTSILGSWGVLPQLVHRAADMMLVEMAMQRRVERSSAFPPLGGE